MFPNQPAYLSKKLPTKRKSPDSRRECLLRDDEQKFKDWIKKDEINSFEDLKSSISKKIDSSWFLYINDQFIVIYRISFEQCPKITISCKITEDLTLSIFKGDIVLDSKTVIGFILGKENKLDRWTKFDNLTSFLSSFEISNLTYEQKIKITENILMNIYTKV